MFTAEAVPDPAPGPAGGFRQSAERNIMELKNIQKEGTEYREAVHALYEEAFPEIERKPFSLMEELAARGKMEMLAVVEDGAFLGLAINMMAGKTALLDYFAISPQQRGGGIGSRSLKLLLERFRDQKYIFEIEMQDASADNAKERERRKAFYLRNGLKETGVFANVYGTDFELLTPDGELSYEEYTDILYDILGDEGVAVLNPRLLSV